MIREKYINRFKKVVRMCLVILIIVTVANASFFNAISFNDLSVDSVKAGSKVNIGKKKLYMYEGQAVKLKNKKYTWKSSNKKVVTVNKKGKIKAKTAGTAKVTASKKIGKKIKKSTCKIYVGKYAKDISVTSAQTIILKKGQISTIKAKVTPDKVLYKDLIYKSENTNIATVSEQGIITPVMTGNTKIFITSKAVNKKKKSISETVTVVVLEDSISPTPTPNGQGDSDNKDLFDDISEGGFVVMTPTPEPTVTPTIKPIEPTEPPTETSGPVPSVTPDTTATPVPTLEPPVEPTASPTPAPTTIAEYIQTLKPDPNHPLVGSFKVANSQGEVRTIYLLNKEYKGNMKLQIDTYTHSADSSVTSLLKQLETERISVKNSSGTIHVYRKKIEDSWTVHFLKENIIYRFSGKQQDTTWGSAYGVIIAEGDTINNIKILTQ